MRIAYDGKRFFRNTSGLGNYSRDLIRVLATYFPQNEYFILNSDKTDRGGDILKMPGVQFQKTTGGLMSRQLNMGKEAQKMDADIFHGLSGELPLKWSGKTIKKAVTIHDLIFLRFPEYYSLFDRKIHLWKFKRAAAQADVIIAISEQTKRDIIQFLKVPEDKITVVYQGCHQAFKENQSPQFLAEVKQKYSLPERFILSVGTVEKRKNLLNTVKGIKDLGIPLVVVGKKTKYFKKVKKYITKNKMEGQVYFPENVPIDDLAALYKMADIFVYPSFFEGFGIPVIEALFSGTPVITSNVSSLTEAGGPGAVYVHPENCEDIRAKISFLWENESERLRRAAIGIDYVQKFTDEQIAASLMSVYQRLYQ